MSTLRNWLRPHAHDCRRSVDVVRVAVAAILVTHPLYAVTHMAALRALAAELQTRALPAPVAMALAWVATATLLLAAPALLVRRLVAPAATAAIVVLVGGAVLLYAPHWYVVGGAATSGHPGVELNVLLVACLSGVLWTYWPRRAAAADDEARAAAVGLELIRLASALIILPHPLHAFVTWDVTGMRHFGEGMSEAGFPFGVQLVWFMVSWQILCSLLIATRRLVVPACVGHLIVLGTGLVIIHYPDWFAVGPGTGGMEFPLVYVACYVGCILAYWPPRAERAQARAVEPAVA